MIASREPDPDHEDAIRRLVRASAPARVLSGLSHVTADAVRGSTLVRIAHRAVAAFAQLPPTQSVRLAGLLLLAAATVHAVLAAILPSAMAPASPWAGAALAAFGAVAAIVLAPALARAWTARRRRARGH